MSALLVIGGAVLLWPGLRARYGRGIALATLVALVFGTAAYGIARSGAWPEALAFAVGAGVLRVLASRLPPRDTRGWLVAGIIAAGILVLRGAGPSAVLDGLFSSWGGLLYWSPILWIAVVGCLRDRGGPAGALAPVLLIAAALGAPGETAAADHGARFASVLPLLGLGLAHSLDAIRTVASRRPLVPIAVAIAVLAAWNGLLMAQYRDGRIPRDDTVSFPAVARNAASTVAGGAGSPVAWPANWIFAARTGVPARRYDLLGGIDVLRAGPRGLGGVIDVGDPVTDEAVLQDGWSVRHPCGAGVCRAVEGTAALWLPLREPRDVTVSVLAAGTGTLTLAVNGVPVLEGTLTSDLRPFAVPVPRARLRRGLNTVSFASAGGTALVDRLVLQPTGDPR